MITDKLTTFARKLALNTGAAGNYLVGTILDTTIARNHGVGSPPTLVISMATAATSGGSATCKFELVTGDAANLSDASVVASTDTLAVAALTAGKTFAQIALPSGSTLYKRYLGIRQVTGTAAFTGGTFDAELVLDARKYTALPMNNGY